MALTPAELARLSPADQERYRTLYEAQHGGLSFVDFVHQHSPELGRVVPRHLRRLYALFQESRIRPVHVTCSMPPRFGKSTSLRQYLAWRLLRDPACLNFYVTFGDSLATDFSYKTRKLARKAGVPIADDRANVHDWATTFDGGLKSTSVGGDITGRGCNSGAIVNDDMLKGRIAAESRLIRDKTFEYLLDDVMTRMERGASNFLVGTRWHLDDPLGRIMRDGLGETWEHIKLAAVVDARTGEPVDGGARGQDFDPDIHIALWPEAGYDIEWARKQRAKGAYRWWSLYQQEPRPRDSKLFQDEPQRYKLEGLGLDGQAWRLALVWDPAGTKKTSSDYQAAGVMGMIGIGENERARILRNKRAQASVPAFLREHVKPMAKEYGLPIYVEAVGGFSAMPDVIRALDGEVQVFPLPAAFTKGGKMEGATPYADAWNQARVEVPLSDPDDPLDDWHDFIEEHREFTGLDDPHDDQVDWARHAFNLLHRGGGGIDTNQVGTWAPSDAGTYDE